jgi:hypothetical protein
VFKGGVTGEALLSGLLLDEVVEPGADFEIGSDGLGKCVASDGAAGEALAINAEEAAEDGGGLERGMKLGASGLDDLGRFGFGGLDLASGYGDGFEEMADAFLISKLDAELA